MVACGRRGGPNHWLRYAYDTWSKTEDEDMKTSTEQITRFDYYIFTRENTPDNKPKQLERKWCQLTIAPTNNESKDNYRGGQVIYSLASPIGKGKLLTD